jgi:FkbM family methyltransferase
MFSRNTKHRILQKLFWNRSGFAALRAYTGLRRRIDYVLLNYSLHSETNGELWLLSLLPEKPLVFDIGYYSGDFTQAVLSRRPGGRVIAFDPSRLAQTKFRNTHEDDRRVVFENMALSNAAGEQDFHDYGSMGSSLVAQPEQGGAGGLSYQVPVMRLDDYVHKHSIPHIDFLKIDAEGYDLNVLEGAGSLLERQAVDFFMFEYADGWISSRRFLRDASDYVQGKPYRMFRLYNGFLAPFTYANRHERFDMGCMFVGASEKWLAANTGVIRPQLF